MQQHILSELGDLPSTVLWALLVISVLGTVCFRVFTLHPNWSSTRHKIATEIFDRLCSAYERYRSQSADSDDQPRAEVLRFEGALQDYCKAPVQHRVGDMALRADSPIQALDDLRKLPKYILFEDNVYKQRFKPYSFPDKDEISKLKRAALWCYLISAIFIGAPVITASLGHFSWPNATLASISLGYLPVVIFIDKLRAWKRSERLYRMSVVIKKNGGCLYGDKDS